jgi:hypothetical protein
MSDTYLNQLTGDEFLNSQHKSLTLLGMSGIGKTTLCNHFPSSNWFKYSGDYRIGTRYLDEHILDNIKKKAMQTPFLADLLRTDSIYICHNITINNLYPVSSFLGKVGNPEKQGLSIDEFLKRQKLHHDAEVNAMRDVPAFIDKAKNIYGYQHFINDAGGSLSELEDPEIYAMLAQHSLIIYLKPSDNMLERLVERAISSPKPMYYQNHFFQQKIANYLEINKFEKLEQVDPDKFIKWVFPQLIQDRIPRYENIAQKYGITIDIEKLENAVSEKNILNIIASTLDAQNLQP